MASILTPRENKTSRGTRFIPAGTEDKKFVEMNAMSLRSGKRKITINADDTNTPQKENIMKKRKSNKFDILNASTLNNSAASLTPKLKDITKAVQNESTKDVTPKQLESRNNNEKFSTPNQQSMKKEKNISSIKKSLNLQNDSVIPLSPKPTHKASTASNTQNKGPPKPINKASAVSNTPTKDIAFKSLETKNNENLSSASRRSMKSINTSVIKKGSDMQNDSVVVLTPQVPNSSQNKSVRGIKKNAVHPANLTEINEMSEIDAKQFLRENTIFGSKSKMTPGCSRNYINASLDSFVLQPLPDDTAELVEISTDSEISMTLNTTYELDEKNISSNVLRLQNTMPNVLSTRKSVHFKNSPEILGPIRRSNSFPNMSIDSSSENISKSIKQRISTPAARRRAGSTPLPSRKQGSSATKLPDFSLIHKRNFEKMESIYDFHHRRKGSSQKKVPPAVQHSKLPRSNNVMVFKATASSTPVPTTSKLPVAPKPRNTPLKPSYSEAKEAVMRKTPLKKTPTQSVSAENNRNILKGVRLNRRFELQMKHRNMK